MTTTLDTGGGPAILGDLATEGGDVVLGHQINLIGEVSAERIETLLPTLRALLAAADTRLTAERAADGGGTPGDGPGRERLRLAGRGGTTVLLSAEAAAAFLPAAARGGDPDDYLAALLVHPRYAPWTRIYVPLAATLTERPTPAGWEGIAPEYTALESAGEGAQAQVRRVPLADIAQAVERHRAFVLLGEPGCGKTTTLYRLLVDLAGERLKTGTGPLPILLPLADDRGYRSPHDFLAAVWRQRLGDADLDGALAAGGLFLLIDALNEMPFADAADYRARSDAWRRFVCEEWPGNRAVFTCRSRDYGSPLGLPQVEIERLDDGRVRAFLERYLPEPLAAPAWERLAADPLLDLVRNPFYLYILCWLVAEGETWPKGRAGLFRGFADHLLAREARKGHPDWPGATALTAGLAALAERMQRLGEGTRLPRAEALARLPARVETPDGPVDTEPKALLRLGLAASLLDTELEPGAQGGERVRFYHHQVQEYFAARALLAAFRRGEDLAERWRRPRLATEMPDPGPLRPDEPLPPPPTTGWEEPTLIAAGLLADPGPLIERVRAADPVLAARCLLEPGVGGAGAPAAGALTASGQAQPVGASVRRDGRPQAAPGSGPEPAPRFAPDLAPQLAPTRQALLALLTDCRTHRRARLAAGEALGRLGDPRFEPFETSGCRFLLPPLVDIPAGTVTLGSTPWEVWRVSRTGVSVADERPRHRLRLPAFAIGRFPVTNAEYACFLADGGYGDERWWDTGQARAWRRGELKSGRVEALLRSWRSLKRDPNRMVRAGWSEDLVVKVTGLLSMSEPEYRAALERNETRRSLERPAYWAEDRLGNPSQPVVGVSWFEARAYCLWLTEQWRAVGEMVSRPLPPGGQLRLPSEAEWERAGRLASGRRFPWGDRWNMDCANTTEGRVHASSPVGAYPSGAASSGAEELAGNVGEWTSTIYWFYPVRPADGRDNPETEGLRVVRGGSWDGEHKYARCACRVGFAPDSFFWTVGFRLVLSLADSGF